MSESTAEKLPITIAISGAGGSVGYGLLFRIAAGGMFGPEQPVALRLLEQPAQMHRLQATTMELADCTFPLLESHLIFDDPAAAFTGSDWIILLANNQRKAPELSRDELIRRNGEIYVEHGRAINHAAPAARILVVGDPCNINCTIAMRYAPDVPRDNWFALNRLERMRAAAFIAHKANVPVTHVNRVTVWGNHSDLMLVDFHNVFINDTPAHTIITDEHWATETLQEFVHRRSDDIFRRCNRSPVATASQAILGTVFSLTNVTQHGRRFGAAVASDGSYGVPRGLVFGFPLRTDDCKNWSIINDLYLDPFAQSQLAKNITQLEQETLLAEKLFG